MPETFTNRDGCLFLLFKRHFEFPSKVKAILTPLDAILGWADIKKRKGFSRANIHRQKNKNWEILKF